MADDSKEKEVATEAEYKVMYLAMIKIFLDMAAMRLMQYPPPELSEGDTYKLSYTAEFTASDVRLLAKKLKIRLPRVKLVTLS